MRQSFYPTTPPLEDQPSLRPSRAFRRSAYAVIIAAFLFCLLYLSLLTLSAGLVAGSVYGGIAIISLKTHALTIIAGAGLIAFGVLFFTFFVKFVFAVNRSHNPHRTEITAEDQPRLYEFIRQLAIDTRAPFPRNIFLVPDVNAAVFYHSSFWSMFWPVRKNLEIGLGLVNSLSVGEFKAVLAHEFGHFSQRSMKLGSYVYTANRALYNLVYEYDRWDLLLDQWVAAGGIFGFFAIITRGMVNGIRYLLRGAYGVINKQYLGLSREMEYHADLVATSVAGHEAMISALRRIELGARAYDHCTDHLNQLAELGKKTNDIYANHRTVLLRLANQYELTVEHGLPQIPDGELAKNLIKSRIHIKDQWASHPSRPEREYNILTQPVPVEAYPQSAWKLFKNPTMLRRDVTLALYEVGFPDQAFQSLLADDFADYLEEEEGKYQISSAYQGFYDGRFLQQFDPEKVIAGAEEQADSLTFEMVYNEMHYKKIARFFADQDDFATLKHIQSGTIATKYFEFDNKKRSTNDIGSLVRLLNSDLARQELWLTELDQQAFLWHYQGAQRAGVASEYVARYQALMSLQQAYRSFSANQQQLDYWRDQLPTKSNWTDQEASELTKELSNIEVSFKSQLRACAAADQIEKSLTEAHRKKLIPYLRSEQAYYLKVSAFDEEAFAHFTNLVFDVWTATRLAYKQSLKSLTDYQLGLRVAEEVERVA